MLPDLSWVSLAWLAQPVPLWALLLAGATTPLLWSEQVSTAVSEVTDVLLGRFRRGGNGGAGGTAPA